MTPSAVADGMLVVVRSHPGRRLVVLGRFR